MPTKRVSDRVLLETLKAYEAYNRNNNLAADSVGIPRTTFQHRLDLAQKAFPDLNTEKWLYPRMIHVNAPSTTWVIGSDIHIWSGDPPPIFQAFLKVAKKADGIILNGDVIDGARISRHGIGRGSKAPKVAEEIRTAQRWLKMLPRAKHRLWTVGNHDIRLDNYIAANANEIDEVTTSLRDLFPEWNMAYAFEVNGTEIRHRFRSGIHGGYNNALHSGVNIVTGHTHQLQVTAVRDRRGTRWGVETGCMAPPDGPQFEYTEGAPTRAQQGFVVLTFDENGEMYPPELCEMINGHPIFRGARLV